MRAMARRVDRPFDCGTGGGGAAFRKAVEAGRSVSQLCAAWEVERADFARRREGFLLYA